MMFSFGAYSGQEINIEPTESDVVENDSMINEVISSIQTAVPEKKNSNP